MNDGEGIPWNSMKLRISMSELIFGHLLTSGNYEKKQKHTGGKNGYGGNSLIFSQMNLLLKH